MTAAYWKLLRLRALFVRSNLINKIDQFATHRAGTEKIIGMSTLLKKFRVGKWLPGYLVTGLQRRFRDARPLFMTAGRAKPTQPNLNFRVRSSESKQPRIRLRRRDDRAKRQSPCDMKRLFSSLRLVTQQCGSEYS